MMPVNLHGNVFDYTASGFKNAWRIATQRLRIEDLHFHDLRHEAISRFFELGSLNVMEIAAISGHRSMNMLKRYTHLRAWQLVSKLDARRRQTQKVAAWFVPYPAHITTIDEEMGRKRIVLRSVILITFTSLPQRKRKQFTAPVRFCCVHWPLQHRKANVSHLPERYLLTTLTTL